MLEFPEYKRDIAIREAALAQLEAIAIAGAALGGSVQEPVVHSVRLENRTELEAAGIQIPYSFAFVHSFNVIAPSIDTATLDKGYRTFSALPPGILHLWRRAARWLWKANAEGDPYDYLLALWIAFNVLYGPHITKGRSEQKAIEAYAAKAFQSNATARPLVDSLQRDDLLALGKSGLSLGRSGQTRIADELDRALVAPEPDAGEMVRLVVLTIYAVRCAIVHAGSVLPSRDEEIRLVWASAHVLKATMMHLLQDLLAY